MRLPAKTDRTSPMTDRTWAIRSPAVPYGMPSAPASRRASSRPAPTPTSRRPEDRKSSPASSWASSRGLRYGAASTNVPTRSVVVAVAAAVMASSGGSVPSVSGTRRVE